MRGKDIFFALKAKSDSWHPSHFLAPCSILNIMKMLWPVVPIWKEVSPPSNSTLQCMHVRWSRLCGSDRRWCGWEMWHWLGNRKWCSSLATSFQLPEHIHYSLKVIISMLVQVSRLECNILLVSPDCCSHFAKATDEREKFWDVPLMMMPRQRFCPYGARLIYPHPMLPTCCPYGA